MEDDASISIRIIPSLHYDGRDTEPPMLIS